MSVSNSFNFISVEHPEDSEENILNDILEVDKTELENDVELSCPLTGLANSTFMVADSISTERSKVKNSTAVDYAKEDVEKNNKDDMERITWF